MNIGPNGRAHAASEVEHGREWRLQERAREGRDAHRERDDDDDAVALAAYRRIDAALRAPPAPALPPDFAAQVAALARARPQHGQESTLERWLLPALLGVLACAATTVVAVSGAAWWQAIASALGAGTPAWGLAILGCAAMSSAFGLLEARRPA